MLTLSAGTIVLVSLGAFIGAVSAGAAGFAFAMTASAIWLHVMDPVRSALLVVASGGLLHAILVWRMRATIDRVRLAPFLLGGLAGVPLGVVLLTAVDTALVRRVLGALMLAHPSAIKRPLAEGPKGRALGFDQAAWESHPLFA